MTFNIAAPSKGETMHLRPGMYAAFAFPTEGFERTISYTPPRQPAEHESVQRTWTVSSYHEGNTINPGDSFSISVKLEPDGLVSSFLHRCIAPGKTLRFLGFSGDFTLNDREPQLAAISVAPNDDPVVLVAGGIGITPMRPILHQLRKEQPSRPVAVLYSVRAFAEAAFLSDLESMAQASQGTVQVIVTATRSLDKRQ
eukprot:scaffold344371_cov52-Prasinocladus_malaysianus.AAC.1